MIWLELFLGYAAATAVALLLATRAASLTLRILTHAPDLHREA